MLTTNIGQLGMLGRQTCLLTPPAMIIDAILADGLDIDEVILSV